MRKFLTLTLATLAIAATAPAAQASAPGAEGKYWHTKTVQVKNHSRQVGRGANKYWVVERRLSEEWTLPNGQSWHGYRPMGAAPKTAADRAAWKRDGSPRKWSYRTEGMLVELSMEPEKGRLFKPKGSAGWIMGYTRLTFEELQAAPTEPEALKSWLQKLYSAPGKPPLDMNTSLKGVYPDLMHRLPVPKGVREAAYKVLTTMPGVTVADAGKDRKKVTERSEDPKYKVRHTFTIDTRNMKLVATDLDTVYNGEQLHAKTWTMKIESGWTDTEPAIPTS
ncbi:hypothetical protein SAMN05444920_111269 [Nonomuraea solani]|uniref:CU044_5270 family protein n=1 Tax=Nonomuraea solani TaxID=1144553 RepID=A0A1H6EMG5_9ACTN|nr:hypothetical protein [Nonomuraea solani]SEG98281.1 hypothetical protein SAMN05444920_111269 [Nonomuraea solani]